MQLSPDRGRPPSADASTSRDVFLHLIVVTDLVAWIALLISALSVLFTWMNMQDRRQSEKTIHVARVSVNSVAHLVGDITVRNDGPSAITIGGIAFAYGPQWVLNAQRPVYWEFDYVPAPLPRRLLPPGEEITVEAPRPVRTDISILGPVVTLVDTNGRQWQRTQWGWRELSEPNDGGPPARRHLWFDHRPWLPRLNACLFKRAQRKVLRRPRRVPWEIRFIEAAWGYRIGAVGYDVYRLPWDAPRTWHYPDLFPPVLGKPDGEPHEKGSPSPDDHSHSHDP